MSYLVTLESTALTGEQFRMEAYQGGNAIEAQIIHGVITGVLHSMKATGTVIIQRLNGDDIEDTLVSERWVDGKLI